MLQFIVKKFQTVRNVLEHIKLFHNFDEWKATNVSVLQFLLMIIS